METSSLSLTNIQVSKLISLIYENHLKEQEVIKADDLYDVFEKLREVVDYCEDEDYCPVCYSRDISKKDGRHLNWEVYEQPCSCNECHTTWNQSYNMSFGGKHDIETLGAV